MKINPETLPDEALEIDAPPAHRAIDRKLRARFGDGRKFRLPLCRQRGSGPLAQSSKSPSGPVLLKR